MEFIDPLSSDSPSSEHRPKARVLAVDDDMNTRLLIEAALSPTYEVRTISSALQLLEALMSFRPHLVVMDVNMPGMDGIQATAQIRENDLWKDLPVLFLTALGDPQTFLRSLRVGGDGYIVKPFSIKDLVTRVEELLQENNIHQQLESEEGAF